MFDYLTDVINTPRPPFPPRNRPSSMRVSLQPDLFPAAHSIWFVLWNIPVTDSCNMPLSMLPDHIQCAA